METELVKVGDYVAVRIEWEFRHTWKIFELKTGMKAHIASCHLYPKESSPVWILFHQASDFEAIKILDALKNLVCKIKQAEGYKVICKP